ncbi:GNAT family N-acetyltransferase [Candidatus Kaiserbacteria bacterium]|nr:GNAT family N-acetyltransferase [Candidatus Kaiserbacteria bacterium]
MALREQPEKPAAESFWKLHGLKGAFVNETSAQDAILSVSNKGEWDKNLSKLQSLFWPLIKEVYSRSDEEVARQLEITFENVDKVFIKTDGSKILGFLCIEKGAPKVAIIRDVIVRKEFQNSGIGKELYASLFAEPEFDAVISATTTLAAEINRFNVGNENGFDSFYGTMGTGNPEVERLRALDTDYLAKTDVLSEDQSLLPSDSSGFVLTKGDYIPRLESAEVTELRERARKQSIPRQIVEQADKILGLQRDLDEKLGKNKAPVVAGHLISIRRQNE